jgi:hypothetical protein
LIRPFDGRAASVGNGVNAFLMTQGSVTQCSMTQGSPA